MLDESLLRASLSRLGTYYGQLDYFPIIDSSNDYLLRQSIVHGRICVADQQIAGRGRRGRQWLGGEGANVQFSIGWAISQPLDPSISLLVSVALLRALRGLGMMGLGVKWPNDVMLEGRKLGGVLVDSRRTASLSEYVIGVGINYQLAEYERAQIGQPVADLVSAGARFSREQVLLAVWEVLGELLSKFQGFEELREEWQLSHIYHQKMIRFDCNAETLQGRVLGVNAQGALCLELAGEERLFYSGEIQIHKQEMT